MLDSVKLRLGVLGYLGLWSNTWNLRPCGSRQGPLKARMNRHIMGTSLGNIRYALVLSIVLKILEVAGNNLRLADDRLWSNLPSDLGVMCVNKVLNDDIVSVLNFKLFSLLRVDLLDGSQHVVSHVLVSVLFEYLSGQRIPFKLYDVDKVAEVPS